MAIYDLTPFSTFFANSNAVLEATNATREIGQLFEVYRADSRIAGARVYSLKAGTHTIRLKLWRPQDTTTPVRTQDFVLPGAGVYQLFWSDPYIVMLYDIQKATSAEASSWMIGLYDPSNTNHTVNTVLNCGGPSGGTGRFTCGDHGYPSQQAVYRHATGEGRPSIGYGSPRALPVDPMVLPASSLYEPTPWVDAFGADRTGIQAAVGNFTTGGTFRCRTFATMYGVRCYSHISGAHTLKGSVWNPNKILRVSGTLAVPGPGYYNIMFSTPYVVPEADLQIDLLNWFVGVWETGGSFHTYVQPAVYAWVPRQFGWIALGAQYGGAIQNRKAGDACPDALVPGYANCPVAPLITPAVF